MKGAKQIWTQCQRCGNISKTLVHEYDVEDIYIDEYKCPRCGYEVGLNCGENKSDIYLYMNSNVDSRY